MKTLKMLVVFCFGVTIGFWFATMYFVQTSNETCDMRDASAIWRDFPTIRSAVDDTTKFSALHNPKWTIPDDIEAKRASECESTRRKHLPSGGYCYSKKKVGDKYVYGIPGSGRGYQVDHPLAEFLANEIFAERTVVDLGAGLGYYGKVFSEKWSKVKGYMAYDGAQNVQEASGGYVRFLDLTQPDAMDERPCVDADWVMSFEVAEHIPPKHTDAFLRNVRCRARLGAVISWALPQQTGGVGHVNTKDEKDAIALVERWGFKVNWNLTLSARNVASFGYFKHDLVVYEVVAK